MSTADSQAPPVFSVIVAVRNGAATIQSCIDSVEGQKDVDVELIVMDGASTDETPAILERNQSAIHYWESKPDRGICHAWNKAIDHARGEWILMLGADDRLAEPSTLGEVLRGLERLDPATTIAYGRVMLVGENDEVLREAGQDWAEAQVDFYAYNTIPHQGVFHLRSELERLHGFNEDFRILGDYELLLRAFRDRDPEFIDVTVARFSVGGLSERSDAIFRATQEAYRARRINGLERWPEWCAPRMIRARAFQVVRRVAGPAMARSVADRFHGRDRQL